MNLTAELAQGIVNQTMDVLGKNINIMNHNGIILGSGNSERINNYHEGAMKVIETGKEFIVSKNEAKNYLGVEAGINLPIKFNNNIIGVVGITGSIGEVEAYGEIVKNLVELMLSYNFLQKEMALENKAKENYYQQLLSNNYNDDLFKDRADLFNIDLDLYRVVVVIKPLPFDNKQLENEIQTLYSLLNISSDRDILFIRGENLIFVKSFETDVFKEQCSIIQSMARLVLMRLEHVFDDVEVGIGQIFSGVDKLHLSYEGAKHALEVGERIYEAKEKIYFLDHLGYDYFIPYLESTSAEYYLHHMLENDIADIFGNTDIGEVIEALVENDLNLSQTADSLFIHRNTLLYRLNKIEELTGLDPRNARYLFTLHLAYHLYLYKKEDIRKNTVKQKE
ncbi:MAG: CdaR family transcriptional regulator [Halanaerobiales bacterium]